MRTRRIAGRYELREQLGDSTWRAVDTELQRDVLVQVPARDAAVARLTHPGIVHVFDQGEEDGEPYAVFEYLPGGSLEQRLEAGPLTEGEAEVVAADVSAALAYAHAEGVTHGSLGPATILFDGEGRAKVAGFAGGATPEEDERAIAALVQTLGAAATGPGDDLTVVLPPSPAAAGRRRPLVLIGLAALALLAAGVGAALVAGSEDSKPASGADSVSLPTSSGSMTAPVVAPPATTSERTTTETPTTTPTTTEPPAAIRGRTPA